MIEYRVILGSASPRRKELLKTLFPAFEVRAADVDEQCLLSSPPQYVMYTAAKKAMAIPLAEDELLITADTTVCLKGAFLGKPVDREDAVRMLHALNHKVNTVYTGVCIRARRKIDLFYEASDVMIDMDDSEIDAYVAGGNALDKAGAYGIQDQGLRATLLSGSLENVIGLPTAALSQHLAAFGIEEKYV